MAARRGLNTIIQPRPSFPRLSLTASRILLFRRFLTTLLPIALGTVKPTQECSSPPDTSKNAEKYAFDIRRPWS